MDKSTVRVARSTTFRLVSARENPRVKLSDLVDAALKLDEAGFGKQFPDPALVFESRSPATGEAVNVDTPSGGSMAYRQTDNLKATDAFEVKKLAALPQGREVRGGDSVVVFLQKTTRNPFAGMITVGRARNNDVCLPLSSVSKVHAYFQKKPGRAAAFTLTDQRSTNGTRVDEKPLAPGVASELHDGARLAFGPDVHARYFTPQGLFGYIALSRAGL